MPGIKKLIICLSLILGFIFIAAITYARDLQEVDIEVSYGYDNTARTGRYLPVHLVYTVKSGKFKGKAAIKTKASDGKIYEYTYPLDFEKSREQTCYIPIGYGIDRIFVNLYDSDSKLLKEKEVELDTSPASDNLLIGILSDTPEALSYFDSVFINYGVISTKSVVIDKNDFPEDSVGLSQLDIIVISNFKIRDLNEAQSMALMDWVEKGGIMLLGTGERVDDTLGRYAPELLDDMYEAPELKEIDLGEQLGIDEPGSSVESISCVNFQLHGGSILIQGDDAPLLSSVNKENGVIAVAAYDFADEAVSDYASKHISYISTVLSKILGNTRLESLGNGLYVQDYGLYSDIQSIINTERADKIPNISILAFLIILYIIIIGPGIFLFLKQRGLNSLYIKIVGIIAVCFTVIIYQIGARTRFQEAFYNYASILDVDEDNISEQTYVNFRNPYNQTYNMDISKQYSVRPVSGESLNFRKQIFNKTDSVDVGLRFYKDKTEINVYAPGAFVSQFFKLERNYENKESIGFSGEISLFKDELKGYITNNYQEKINSVAIILYGKLVLLGDMEANQTIDLDGLKVYNIPLTNLKAVSKAITGIEKLASENISTYESEAFYMEALGKAELATFYMSFHQSGYSADARIIGFTENKPDNNIVLNKEIKNLGISLLVSQLNTDNKKGDLIYRSALMKNPTLLGGVFFANINAFYPVEPLVLEYQIGDDIEIDELNFETISSEFLSNDKDIEIFEGEMYFFNYFKGSYDKKEIRNYSIDELKEYLSPPKTIRIRYVYKENNSALVVSLPMISVTGSDNEPQSER